MGVDLKLYGQRICLQAFSAGCSLQILNIICTNQGSDGEVLHMRVGKTYKAEINLNLPIKQKGSTELLFCYTELVRFCCPSHSRGSHRSPSTKLVKVFSLLLARLTVLYLWYINLHFSWFYSRVEMCSSNTSLSEQNSFQDGLSCSTVSLQSLRAYQFVRDYWSCHTGKYSCSQTQSSI